MINYLLNYILLLIEVLFNFTILINSNNFFHLFLHYGIYDSKKNYSGGLKTITTQQ